MGCMEAVVSAYEEFDRRREPGRLEVEQEPVA